MGDPASALGVLMKKIEIRDQPSLGVGKTLSLTLTGIRYRLFRSLVTVGVVAVAMAFLMNVLSESLVRGAVLRATTLRAAQLHQAYVWVTKLSDPGVLDSILTAMAAPRPEAVDEAVSMAKLPPEDGVFLESRCRQAAEYLRFFAALDYGARRQLTGKAEGTAIFDGLQSPAAQADFFGKAKEIRSLRLPGGADTFQKFLREWPGVKEKLERIRAARAAAIAQLQGSLRGRTVMEALAEADGAFGAAIRAAGFRFPEDVARTVAEQARQACDGQFLEAGLLRPAVRQAVAGRLDLTLNEVNPQVLWTFLRSRESAAWYLDRLKEADIPVAGLTPERLMALARVQTEEATLAQLVPLQADVEAGETGIQERMLWLILVSMVVCAVGIANAMLMSVTERFREIATLKCLGALDRTIMGMCVIEATILGVTGGAAGALAGTLLGLSRMSAAFGGIALSTMPIGALCLAMAGSILVGIALAAVAALYPSFKAARLAPMEAMRVE
jgi:putative ABC transport system permease protein